MKLRALLIAVLAATLLTPPARAITLFEDGFDTGELGPDWTDISSGTGRARLTGDFSPADGTHHLVLDDSETDATFATAAVAVPVDVRQRKNITLQFKAKSLGNEAHPPPGGIFTTEHAYDGVAVSTDGGQSWITVASLADLSASWEEFTVSLDSSLFALGAPSASTALVRFSAYDNSEAPSDGIAIDSILITADLDQQTALELPASAVEGSTGNEGLVLVSIPPLEPLTLTFSAIPDGQLALPENVVVPAGATGVVFAFDVIDDTLLNPTRTVTLSAEGPGVTSAASTLTLIDNDTASATLQLPDLVTEGSPAGVATVVLSHTATTPIAFTLSASPADEVILPATVTINPGEKEFSFNIGAVDDSRIDGNVTATITAESPGIPAATATITVADNEPRTLTLTLPVAVTEGDTATGSVVLAGTLTAPLTVSLTSSAPGLVSVQANVVVPAGQTSATFSLQAADNEQPDTTAPSVAIAAFAEGFESASRHINVADNDPASVQMDPLPRIVNISNAVPIVIRITGVSGSPIPGHSSPVTLSAVLPDDTTVAVTPGTVTLDNSTWSGSVSIPPVANAPLRLRAVTSGGLQTESTPFDILRTVSMPISDLVWDAGRQLLYISQPAAGGDKVTALNPLDLTTAATLNLSNTPERLALTSNGEFLYCHLAGNGSIARINPATMGLVSTFAVGIDPIYGPLYAADMCTVAGQPNLLVISQRRASVTPEHNGVAVYDNGVIRPLKTQDHTGSNEIEPSSDPTLFFGQNTETSEFGFRRLRLTAQGIQQIDVLPLFSGFGLNFRSDGDLVYTAWGEVANGTEARRIGKINVIGRPCPDPSTFRVYYLEGDYPQGWSRITSFDPVSLDPIESLPFSAAIPESTYRSVNSFIRWGETGLAFSNGNTLYLVNSASLVPADPPADVAVTVTASPNPATTGSPVTYEITVTNAGPNPSLNTKLSATFSEGQTLQTLVAPGYSPHIAGKTITLDIGSLPAGDSVTLTVPAIPEFSGVLSCAAGVNSSSIDLNTLNNSQSKIVNSGFASTPDSINEVRISVNNLVADPTRNLLWATIPETVAGPLGKKLVSIDPLNGLVSDPIDLQATPVARCMALSHNGRYLYVGLSDVPEVCRLDLSVFPPAQVRIPLGVSQWGSANYAQDIEVLEGSGLSFMLASSSDHSATVFDGSTMRTNRTGIYTVDRIEPAGGPNLFAGYNNYTSGFDFSSLIVDAEGVTVDRSVSQLIERFGVEIDAGGSVVLASTGRLINFSDFTIISDLPSGGLPCVDFPNGLAYLVQNNALRAYSVLDGSSRGFLALPVSSLGDWAGACIRWGRDGFAIAGAGDQFTESDRLYIVRWSQADQSGADTDGNGIDDVWERTHFFRLGINPDGDEDGDGLANALEYLMLTDPRARSVASVAVGLSGESPRVLRLVYDRRRGIPASAFEYESSTDLGNWQPATGVAEKVLSTGILRGEPAESIEVLIPWDEEADQSFTRIRWKRP